MFEYMLEIAKVLRNDSFLNKFIRLKLIRFLNVKLKQYRYW